MRRWPEILLTLVLFAAAMAGVSWVVNATVPGAVDWAWDRFGGFASWAIFLVLMAGCGLYAWRGHRTAGKNPNGT
ncbi:ABC-type uncharacterized transport system permease subunit [Methylobacterium sp. PvP062]|nr:MULTISPECIES: hypothetical protein [unclassified Methylobacterium]MBP2495303.1 ABC-type uncharacterized transport system permease subunit [Methylobacterium sp. PvP105]MBP2504826.1 ABC-type uncharacterized transport system permease subunit [Methylobacterium sp. PvP109]MCX7335833.1 hypothetical protein [Hyphomicrobiales bacterium]